MNYPSFKHTQRGFTLVELLVVISLIGILTAVTFSIINPKKQRDAAEDGVKRSNLQKYALGIEAYGNANSTYPTDSNGDKQPDGTDVSNFVSKIPNDEPKGSVYSYWASTTVGDAFAITVPSSENPAKCFKYRSAWGKVKICDIAICGSEVADAGCL